MSRDNTTSNTAFAALMSPLQAGRHHLRNRVIMGSMYTGFEHLGDSIARQAAFYEARTRNGVAPGPRGRVVYPRPHGPGATPLRAAYLER